MRKRNKLKKQKESSDEGNKHTDNPFSGEIYNG